MDLRTTSAVIALLVLASCSDSSSSSDTHASSTTVAPTTVAPTTVAPTTVAPTTTRPTTTAATTAPATTAPVCATDGDVSAKTTGEPLTLSPIFGTDIQATARPCYEEITIRLKDSGTSPSDFPGWSVEYVDDPVPLGESGETVSITGDATLLVRMGSWMPTMEGEGYSGPLDIVPTGVSHILEMRSTSNFEGVTVWAIGLDFPYPFTVTVPDGPLRLVIQLQIGT